MSSWSVDSEPVPSWPVVSALMSTSSFLLFVKNDEVYQFSDEFSERQSVKAYRNGKLS